MGWLLTGPLGPIIWGFLEHRQEDGSGDSRNLFQFSGSPETCSHYPTVEDSSRLYRPRGVPSTAPCRTVCHGTYSTLPPTKGPSSRPSAVLVTTRSPTRSLVPPFTHVYTYHHLPSKKRKRTRTSSYSFGSSGTDVEGNPPPRRVGPLRPWSSEVTDFP